MARLCFEDISYKPDCQVKYILCLATALCGWMAIVLYYVTHLKGKLGKRNREKSSEL